MVYASDTPKAGDAPKAGSFILGRTFHGYALQVLIAVNIAMTAVGVSRSPAFFSQSGARTFVLETVCALLAYAVATVYLARTRGPYWDSILTSAFVFGVTTGIFEVMNVGFENGIPLVVRGPLLPIGFMLLVFTSWGIAGFRTTRSLNSVRAGILAAVLSAAICMLIAVTAGFVVEFFLAPPEPTYVSTWAEFKRSGWTDAGAFAVANTLDSGFTHLVVAPIVALLFGGLASLISQFTHSKTTPISQ